MKLALHPPTPMRPGRRAAGVLLGGLALVALGAAAAWVVRQPAFLIVEVRMAGDSRHSGGPALQRQIGASLGQSLFTVDLAAVRQGFEALPWVRRAQVRREFPNRLRVTLEEHVAEAYWGAAETLRLLNQQGEVFEANLGEVEREDLPTLNGPQGQSAQVLDLYRSLRTQFAAVGLTLGRLELTGRGNWEAELDGGAQLALGRGDVQTVGERAQRFVTTLPEVTARYGRSVGTLLSADLRHQDGYALRLRGVSTVLDGGQKK